MAATAGHVTGRTSRAGLHLARAGVHGRKRAAHPQPGTHIIALADALRVSPYYLADGRDDPTWPVRLVPGVVPFPARGDPIMLARHQQLARELVQLARLDGRAAGDWLRRLAREPTVNPWLLLDQLTTTHAHPPITVKEMNRP